MRKQSEILEKIAEFEADEWADWIGTKRTDLIKALEYENAKPFLEEGVTEEDWKPTLTDGSVRDEMKDYMEFAWDKANNERGLSAGRSLEHYWAWFWLLGEDKKCSEIEEYEFYGKDHLRMICEFLGLDADQWDDGRRVNYA